MSINNEIEKAFITKTLNGADSETVIKCGIKKQMQIDIRKDFQYKSFLRSYLIYTFK